MIQPETILKIADNTGGKTLKCIRVLGGSVVNSGTIGDVIVGSVQSSSPGGSVKKGDVVRAVIVRTTYAVQRKDGTTIRFGDNAVVILDKDVNPKGTRVFGPIAREVRARGYLKISSLAPKVF